MVGTGRWITQGHENPHGNAEYIRRDPAVLAALPEVQAIVEAAVRDEREACASVADRIADKYWRPMVVTRTEEEVAVDDGKMDAAFEIAAAIRNRSEKKP